MTSDELKTARSRLNMSPCQMAEALNIPVWLYERMEMGVNGISQHIANEIIYWVDGLSEFNE